MAIIFVFYASILISTFSVVTADSYKYCSDHTHARDPTVDFLKLKDAYKVSWAHAVNSPSKLDQALSSNTMMLEADIQMRHNRSDTEPIMAHPLDTDSNLTLAEFVGNVSKSEKGMQLDFNTIISVEPSLKHLKNVCETKMLKNPIWLNADILKGPCHDKVCIPVDPTQFIKLCEQYFPSSVLSIGWTTGNDLKPVENMYTWSNVIEMGKLVAKISQPVTFPVRASLVKRSLQQLLWLLDISRNLTLTVWSSEKDDARAADLVELRKNVYDKKNVYYDLPKSQADAFAKALEGVDVSTKDPYDNHNNDRIIGSLRPYATETCTDVLVGETKVMFTGKGGWVSTTKEVKAIDSRKPVEMYIDVVFLSLGLPDVEQSITLVFGSKGLTGSPTASVKPSDGVQFTLKRNGEVTVIKPDGSKTKSQGVSDPKFQYNIVLWHGPKMDHITFVLRGRTNGTELPIINYKGDFKPEKQYVLIGVGDQQGAVLVDRYNSALTQPSGSGSSITTPLKLLLLVTMLFVSSVVMLL